MKIPSLPLKTVQVRIIECCVAVGIGLAMSWAGCTFPGSTPLELSSLEPSPEQWQIAAFHEHEAVVLRQKADDAERQAQQYERLFGRDSDWVNGARLLAESYREMAAEHEHMAGVHGRIARENTPRRKGETRKEGAR